MKRKKEMKKERKHVFLKLKHNDALLGIVFPCVANSYCSHSYVLFLFLQNNQMVPLSVVLLELCWVWLSL